MGRSNYSTNGLLNAVTKRAFNRYTPTTVDYQHLEAATTTSGLVSNRREYSSALLLADKFSLSPLNLAQANYDPFLKSVLSTDWEDTLKELTGESGFNTGLDITLSSDGTKLAVIARDTIYLEEGIPEIKVYNYDSTRYDLASPENVATHTYQSVSYTISGIDSTDDGHQVVAVLNDQALQKFSLSETNVLTSDTRFSFGPLGGTGDLTVNLSHDGKRVFVFQPDGPFRVYDYPNLSSGYYTGVGKSQGFMSKDGSRVVTLDPSYANDAGIHSYDIPKASPVGVVNLEKLPRFQGPNLWIWDQFTILALSYDGKVMLIKHSNIIIVITWNGVGYATIHKPNENNKIVMPSPLGNHYNKGDISRDGTYVIVGGYGASGAPVKTFKWDPSTETYNEYGGTTLYAVNNADSISINQNGDKVAIGTNTNTSQIYTLADGTWNRRTTVSGTSGEGKVGCVRVANDGRAFATASDSRITFFGDFTNKQYPVGWTQRGNTISISSYVKSIDLSDDGNYLIVGLYKESTTFLADIQANAGKVRVYSLSGSTWSQRGADIEYDTANTFFGSAVAISPDGSKFAAGGNGIVRVFKNEVGTNLANLKNTISSIPLTPQSSLLEMSGDGSRLVVNRTIFDDAVAKGGVDSADALNLSNDGNHLAVEANNTASLYGINSQGVVSLVGTSISPADSADNAGDYRTNTAYSSTKINVNAANSQLLNLASSYGTTTEICSLTYDPTIETTSRTTTNRILTTESSEITGFASHSGIVISRDGGTLAVYDNAKFSIYNYTNSAWTFVRTKTVTSGPYLVVLSHDGSRVAYRDGSLKVENSLTGASLGSISVASLYTYAFKSNTSLTLLQGTNDIELYDYDGTNWILGETVTYSGTNSSTSLLWSGDGTRLAAGDSGSNRRVSFFEYDSTLSAPVFSFVQEGSAHAASLQALSGTGDVKVLGTSTGFEIHEASGTATFTGGAATSIDVSIDGTRVVVGTSSKMYVVHKSAGVWTQLGSDITGNAPRVAISRDGSKIFSNDLVLKSYEYAPWNQVGSDIDGEAAYGQFGRSVSISSDGTRVAIGTPFDGNGHVRIYSESGGTWSQVGSDIDGGAAYDESGFSISLSSDGTRVAIGAPRTDWGGNDHVRVYAESSGVWNQVGSDIDGEAAGDQSGYAVSMSSDGSRVVIGAPFNTSAGHVRVYSESNGWTTYLPDLTVSGITKASTDGDIVAVGTDVYSKQSVSTNTGYTFNASGSTFSGTEQAVSGNGNVRVVADKSVNSSTGQALIYEKVGGSWSSTASATFTGASATEEFGRDVDVSNDGTRVVIGSGTKMVVVEKLGGTWSQLGSDISGSTTKVAISRDGSKVFGYSGSDMKSYEYVSGSWTQYLPDLTGLSSITRLAPSTDGDIVALSKNNANQVYSKQSVTTGGGGYTISQSVSLNHNDAYMSRISNNGLVAVTGDEYGDFSAGEVKIFEKDSSGNWPSTASATYTGSTFGGYLGRVLGVSDDGTRVAMQSSSKMKVVEKPSAATTTYTVTVASVGGGNRYHIDGVDRAPLTFYRGNTYVFNLSHSSNNNHPLVFSPSTTGVVDNYSTNLPGTTGSQVSFTVPANAPSSMTYLCQTHGSGMGSTITVSDRVWTQLGSDITASFNAITGSCMSGDGTKVFGANGSDLYSWEYSGSSWSQYRSPVSSSYSSIGRISHSTNGEIVGIEESVGIVDIFSTTSSSASYSQRHSDSYYTGKYHSLSNDGANLVLLDAQSGSMVWNGTNYVYDGASGTQVPWYTTSTSSFVEISRNGNFVFWLDNGTNNLRIYSKSTVNGNVQWTLETSLAYTYSPATMSPLGSDAIVVTPQTPTGPKIYDITYTAGSTTDQYATRGSVISGNMIDMSDDGSKVVSWISSGSMTWNGSTDYAYDGPGGTQVPWHGSNLLVGGGGYADFELTHNIRISGDGTRVVATSSAPEDDGEAGDTFLRMWFKSGSSWVDTGVTVFTINNVNTVDVSLNTDGTFFGIGESTQVRFFDVIYSSGTTTDQYVIRGSGLGFGSNHDLSDDGDYVVYTGVTLFQNVIPGAKAWNGSSWAYNGPAATSAGWSYLHTVLALSGDATKAIAFKSTTNEVILYTKDAQHQWSENVTLTQTGVTALSIDTDGSIVGVVANSQTKFYTFGSTQSPIGWYSHSSFQDTAEPGFAQSFDISNDGDAVVVGVSGDGTSSYRGAVRVYDYTSSWALRSTITPPSETAANGNVGYRNLGKSVSVSSDGTKIAYLGDQGTYSGGTLTTDRSEASTRDWQNSAWVNPAYASDEVTLTEVVPVSENRDLETISMSYDGARFGVRASSGSYDAIVKKLDTLVITTTDTLGWTKRGDIISFDTTDSVAATTSRSMRSSVDGNTVAFGYVNSSGVKIRVYSFASGSWSQLGSEISTTGTTISMDVSNDGTRVAVISGDTGRVFTYGGGSWSQFGSSIAFRPTGVDTIKISGNGNYVALGNNTPSDPYPFNILRVYKKNVDWELISPTMTLAKTPSNFFGAGFGLLNDGSRLVHYTDSGVEFASFITTVGTDFTQHSTDITGNGVGSNLAFDNSGSTLVTSSFTDNVIRVYDSSHNQVTTFDVKIMYADIEQPFGSPDAMETKPFAITKDGTKIVTVAPPGVSGLRAIVYKKQNGVWSQEGNTIEITVTDRISSVDISSDGNTVIVGSIEEAANGANPCPGRAQAFTLSNGTWSQLGGTITNPEGNHRFSNVVAISDVGTIVAAGHYTYNGGRPFGVVKTYESKDEVQDISFGPPIIQLIGNSYVRLPINVVYEELGATVTTQASIVPEIKITGTVQTGIPGVYTLRYECEDSLRKKATPIFRRVEIISAIQTFRIKGEPIVYHTKDVLYTDQGIEVFSGYEDGTDFEMFYITPGSPFSPILVSNSAFTPTQEGDYTIVWVDQLVDEYLRTGSLHTRIVRVREIPVITLTGGSVIYHRLFDPFVDPGVTITQSSYGFEGTTAATAVNPNLSGVYTITYTAVDKFGIEATPITRTVEVKARPIINITGNQFYHLINNPVSLPPVTVTTPIGYASDLTPSLQSSNDIDQNTEGDYTIQHSLTDATSGISAEQKSQKFSVGSHGRLNFSKIGTAFTFTGTSLVVFDTALRTYDIQTDGTWGLYSTLTVPSTATSIKMTKDGQFMVVGMSSHLTIGLVQVYRRNALFQTGWQQLGFDIFGTDYLGGFGAVVDINNSGTRIVVGAPQVTKTIIKAGLVGVYDWSGFFWNRTKLFEGTLPNELLGFSVSLDSIGTTLALGSPGHSVTTISPGSNITTVNVGKTAVYKLGESDWTLLGLEIQDGPVNKRNGTSVSLSRDGENLVVGSVLGGARVYNLRNNDTWTVQGSQILPNIGGKSVSISGDKGLVAVGSEDEYGGRVYIFRYNQGWSNATETFDKVVTEQDTSLLGKYVVFDDSGALLCLLTDTEVRIYGV